MSSGHRPRPRESGFFWDYNNDFWEKTFDFLLGYINAYKESNSISANRKDSLLMFVDKTEKEYVKLMYEFDFFRTLRLEEEFILNGKSLKSFNIIWGKLKEFRKSNIIHY